MTGDKKRRQKYLRKTKAELVDKLEALERELAKQKRTGGSKDDESTIPLFESEALFRVFVDNVPAAVYVRDVEGRYLLVNKAYEDLYGVEGRKILGKTPYEVFSRESADFIMDLHKEVLKKSIRIDRETQVSVQDDTTRAQWISLLPLKSPGGETIGVCGILTDLAEQKHAEKAIRESEERLRSAIESLQGGFALYDHEDRLVAFNNKYGRMRPEAQEIMEKGGTFEDVIRANVKSGLIPEAQGREEAFIKDRIKRHQNPKGPIIRRLSDGTWNMIKESRTPEGGIAISFVDITELKRAEEALRKSEALFRAVVSHSPAKIHIKDVEGRYTLISKEAEKLFGITDEEGRGKTSYDLFPKKVADAFMAHDKEVIESGKAIEEEEEFELEDGVHTFLTVKFPIYDLDGVTGVGAIGTDITERKKAEEGFRRLAAAIEGLSENFALYGPDDRLIMCNEGYREINKPVADTTKPGVSFEEHVRALVEKGLVPEAKGREEDYIRKRLEQHWNPGKPFELERQDGRWFLVNEQRMPDGSTVTIAPDITERKKAEEALQQAKEQAEFANRSKTEFLANMSHELRTPLNSILGFSEVLMTEIFGPLGAGKYKEYAQDINSSGAHLLSLINEVLDLSKLEAGELKIVESEIDVTEAVKACVKMVEGRATDESPAISTKFENGLPLFLGDERRLKQILLNLLGNAVKFTPPEGEVNVSARICKKGRFTIEVADEGVGIAPKDIPKVLKPFGQVRDAFTRDYEGSGLGLYLAKSFTEMHGGTLDIASQVGKGTIVTLKFPKERTLVPGRKGAPEAHP